MKRLITMALAVVVVVTLGLVPVAPVAAADSDPVLAARWSFDEGSGQIAADATGTNDGQLGSMTTTDGSDPTWVPTSPFGPEFGSALSFDGGDYVIVEDDGSLDITSEITIEAWIQPASVNGYRTIVAKRSGSVANYALRLSSGKVEFYYRKAGATIWSEWRTNDILVSAGNQYHIAVTYTFGESTSIMVYVDGISYGGSWIYGVADPITENDFPVRIGYYSGQGFSGVIDEVRIWSSALDVDQLDDMDPPTINPSVSAFGVYPAGTQLDFGLSDGDGTGVKDVVATLDGYTPINGEPLTVGIYDLVITATDYALNEATLTVESIVVYDPSAGFVTGGGWIDSPSGAYMPSDSTVVTEADVGVNWFTADTRYDGYATFVEGPVTPPLGSGSLEMGTTASRDKAQLFNYDHMGTLLADIESITYATYRDSSSTNSPLQYPAINIEVDYMGDGSSYTTLVWEPIYAYGAANLLEDTWQTWDTMAPSQTSFGGGWWSTKDIPGVCAFNCFVDWETIVQNNPNAKIKYGFGINVGSGWVGTFTGAVDALTITVNGETTTYDFEAVAPPTGKATFGFVSKYKKGASVPDGQTEFQFNAADLNFHSTSYDWLVVTGSDYAKFKGIGTINGEGEYKFQIWAGDGTGTDGADTFRIKIWYEVGGTESVVYDNGMDQAIGGGSIVVHTSKK